MDGPLVSRYLTFPNPSIRGVGAPMDGLSALPWTARWCQGTLPCGEWRAEKLFAASYRKPNASYYTDALYLLKSRRNESEPSRHDCMPGLANDWVPNRPVWPAYRDP